MKMEFNHFKAPSSLRDNKLNKKMLVNTVSVQLVLKALKHKTIINYGSNLKILIYLYLQY